MGKTLKKGLDEIFGQDLDSLLDDISTSGAKSNTSSIKIKEIRPNPYQPRKTFDQESLNELADSIKTHGVFQPILVRKTINGYELIAGERRLRASKLAKLSEIPAIVVDFDDTAMMEISLLENIQREDLSVVEEAKAYENLIQKLGYTQEKLAERVGKSRTHITNTLRLLKLPNEVLELISNGKLSFGHARALINIEDQNLLIELANRAVKEKLTVRDIEKLANKAKQNPPTPRIKVIDPYLENVRRIMESKLSAPVSVDNKKIVINYASSEDLNRILETLGCLEESLND